MAAALPRPKRSCFLSGECFPPPAEVATATVLASTDEDVEAVVACEAAMAAAAVADSTIMRSILGNILI